MTLMIMALVERVTGISLLLAPPSERPRKPPVEPHNGASYKNSRFRARPPTAGRDTVVRLKWRYVRFGAAHVLELIEGAAAARVHHLGGVG
jgi:hypothetical protein